MGSTRKRRLPQLEVRSRVDGAWYDGDIFLEGSQLRVHFNGFGQGDDEIWNEEFLRSTAKFKEIVRLRSRQLQDSECKKVLPGMVVCANYKSPDGSESKYFDARILVVHQSEHYYQKRAKEELCKCQFKVVWESGPQKDHAVILGCAEISLIVSEDVQRHPVAEKILGVTRDNSEASPCKSDVMGTRKRKNTDPDIDPDVDIEWKQTSGVVTPPRTNPRLPTHRRTINRRQSDHSYPKRGNDRWGERAVHTSGRRGRWAPQT